MTRHDEALRELREELADRWRAVPGSVRDRQLAALDATLAELERLREVMSTLVYWHDEGGHVDASWWDEARKLVRVGLGVEEA